ncbi:hypothetical protein RHGRI_003147 [Rhododendron griersonianum]|uniref:Folate-biopterin transporter 7 n=1 Tax=Rhododendron griersonianum TaxID=479676 RepID=A0AAV6LRS8_9ERIC|nr:hypothetical protein RHGRI_003147 [Rhododendron griersonianum]
MGSSNNNYSSSCSKDRNSNSNNNKKGVKMRKDGLKVDPSTLQLLQNSANLPMVAKPIYGLLSDSVYITGQHRLPYIAIGDSLRSSYYDGYEVAEEEGDRVELEEVIFVEPNIEQTVEECSHYGHIEADDKEKVYLGVSEKGEAIIEVDNKKIDIKVCDQVVEDQNNFSLDLVDTNIVKEDSMASDTCEAFLQALSWIAIACYSPSDLSFFMITLYLLLGNLGASIVEVANDAIVAEVGKQSKNSQSPSQGELQSFGWMASSIGGVLGSLLAASYAIIPALTGTMFFYQTQYLEIESSVLGISKVIGQAAMFLWGVTYNRHLKSVPPKKLISVIQSIMAVFMLSDVLFVKGLYRSMGIPDSLYVLVFSGFLEVLCFFKILPFSILVAQLCPPGCEGSLMAFLMSSIALAFIVSGYLGVALASYVGVTGNDFSGLSSGLLTQAACTLLPLYWSSCMPDEPKTKRKEQ